METAKKKLNLLVGVSGSVAAIKLPELLQALKSTNLFELKVIITQSGVHFLQNQLPLLKSEYTIIQDQEEWKWRDRSDEVLHIELRKWADILLIAPLSANTLAKTVNGICDNTLSLVVRCWDFNSKGENGKLVKPIVVCPAMNTMMYDNPITARQLQALSGEMGIRVIDPIEKVLVCGEKGIGAMARVEEIVKTVVALAQTQALKSS